MSEYSHCESSVRHWSTEFKEYKWSNKINTGIDYLTSLDISVENFQDL